MLYLSYMLKLCNLILHHVTQTGQKCQILMTSSRSPVLSTPYRTENVHSVPKFFIERVGVRQNPVDSKAQGRRFDHPWLPGSVLVSKCSLSNAATALKSYIES